ncbi:YceI family protein [Rhodococcus marinonascens]|uniref:YceI family protein n=1 Tax=Rhodococcus marinonascens TaxID=38311 RepID=UPI000932E5C0|nr:YceI family protein [Rhodococcus marinonascens]
MKKRWWVVGGVIVVILAVLVGPWVYGTFIVEDDDPAASVSSDGAQAATGTVDGQWTVTPGGGANQTAAGYTVDENLNGAANRVVGTTSDVAGTATVEEEKLTAAEVTVQVATIATDVSIRDGMFRDSIVDTDAFPAATFALSSPVDLSSLPKDGTAGTVTAQGMLTLKGESRPVSVDMDVLHSGDNLIASGSIPVTWTDFDVQPPSLGFVTVQGNGTVDFLVCLSHS